MTTREAIAVHALADEALDQAIIAQHAADPVDLTVLSALYREGAQRAGDRAAARFALTHAWVLALEAGDARSIAELERELRACGGLAPPRS